MSSLISPPQIPTLKQALMDTRSPRIEWKTSLPSSVDVSIIGGGFCGLVTLVQLLRKSFTGTVALYERTARHRPGVAFGESKKHHLLNVPVGKMSAFESEPNSFFNYLNRLYPGEFTESDFARRSDYGEYLLELLHLELQTSKATVHFIRGSVERIIESENGFKLTLITNQIILTRSIVLATGIEESKFAPGVDASVKDSPQYIQTPWTISHLNSIPRDAEVVILGTGLTAIDVLLSLVVSNHSGPIRIISRNGRFPKTKALDKAPSDLKVPVPLFSADLNGMVSIFRKFVKDLKSKNISWQHAIDLLRPHTQTIWKQLTLKERKRFLRHLRPFWEVHRHRATEDSLVVVNNLIAEGKLIQIKAKIKTLEVDSNKKLFLLLRSRNGEMRLGADYVINCIGPSINLSKGSEPLLINAINDSVLRLDALSIGIDCDDIGRARRTHSGVHKNLFVVGALRRASLWESTAVPELRKQTEQIAEYLVNSSFES